jgi:hypothetical protein
MESALPHIETAPAPRQAPLRPPALADLILRRLRRVNDGKRNIVVLIDGDATILDAPAAGRLQ